MQSLIVKISNPDTVHAIADAAKRQGTTPEVAALELLETAVLAQKPFEEIVEPYESSMLLPKLGFSNGFLLFDFRQAHRLHRHLHRLERYRPPVWRNN